MAVELNITEPALIIREFRHLHLYAKTISTQLKVPANSTVIKSGQFVVNQLHIWIYMPCMHFKQKILIIAVVICCRNIGRIILVQEYAECLGQFEQFEFSADRSIYLIRA